MYKKEEANLHRPIEGKILLATIIEKEFVYEPA